MLVGSFKYQRNQQKLPRGSAVAMLQHVIPLVSRWIAKRWQHRSASDNLFYHQCRVTRLNLRGFHSIHDDRGHAGDLQTSIRAIEECAALYLARLPSPHSRRAYAADVRDFLRWIRPGDTMADIGPLRIQQWQLHLQSVGASPATQRRKLSALSTLFRALCSEHVIAANPVAAVRRPRVDSYEGKTPALSDQQVRILLDAPDSKTPKGKRDRAILALLLYLGLRRGELCALNVGDLHLDRGEWRLSVRGKGGKRRSLPMHPQALSVLRAYLKARGKPAKVDPMFTAISNPRGDGRLSGQGVYSSIVRHYGAVLGLTELTSFGPHVMRATVATQPSRVS